MFWSEKMFWYEVQKKFWSGEMFWSEKMFWYEKCFGLIIRSFGRKNYYDNTICCIKSDQKWFV
jgi:hypothetical protein